MTSFDLERFVEAQNPVYNRVCGELRNGRKSSHWMWFIFPQIRGLGGSPTSVRYAIASLDEAKAYLNHPILGPRLEECTGLVNRIENRSIEEIFGCPDELKFRSSMTLFAHAAPAQSLYRIALDKYFRGESDPLTVARL